MLVNDAISLLKSFALWSAGHIKREANFVAHFLAKHAISLVEDIVVLECIPNCIKHLAILDDVILK